MEQDDEFAAFLYAAVPLINSIAANLLLKVVVALTSLLGFGEAVCSVQAKLASDVATLRVLTDDATRKAGENNLVAKLAAQLAAAGKEVPPEFQRDLQKLTKYLAGVLAGKEE